jgi:hypothetical protein
MFIVISQILIMSSEEASVEDSNEEEEESEAASEAMSEAVSESISSKALLKSTINKLTEVTDYLQLLVKPTGNSSKPSYGSVLSSAAMYPPQQVTFRAHTNTQNPFKLPRRRYRFEQAPGTPYLAPAPSFIRERQRE